jgi:hypothetical protein
LNPAETQPNPDRAAEMVDAIQGELQKPGKAAAEASKIAPKLRAKNQRRYLPKNAELGPIETKPFEERAGGVNRRRRLDHCEVVKRG